MRLLLLGETGSEKKMSRVILWPLIRDIPSASQLLGSGRRQSTYHIGHALFAPSLFHLRRYYLVPLSLPTARKTPTLIYAASPDLSYPDIRKVGALAHGCHPSQEYISPPNMESKSTGPAVCSPFKIVLSQNWISKTRLDESTRQSRSERLQQ